MSCAISYCVFTCQTKSTVAANAMAIQAAKLSDSTPSELHVRLTWPSQLFQVKGTFATKMSWDLANRNRGVRFGGKSHACSDDRVFIASRDVDSTENEKNLVAGVASRRRSPSKGPSKTIVHPKKESDILDKLKTISLHLLASEQWNSASLGKCNRIYVVNGTNLAHYLALKYLDIQQLNEDLLSLGLLDLDDITPYVLACLNSCIQMLESSLINSLGNTLQSTIQFKNEHLSIANMRKQSTYCRERLLGPLQGGRTTHIMVTIGQEALESPSMIPDILVSGATVVRINCAHGNMTIWSEIIKRVRKSSQELEKPCRILMDLAGPKLRTEMLKESPYVMKVSPTKMATRDLTSPAQVWLSYKGSEPPAHLSPDAIVYLDNEEFLSSLQLDDIISFSDARGKQRTLKISLKLPNFAGVMSECKKTAYVMSGSKLCVKRKGKKGKRLIGVVGDFPPEEQYIKVKAGDLLIISQGSSIDQDKMLASTRCVHRVTCSSGYLFDSVKPGDTISFDDGKIWGVIQGSSASEITVSITHAGLKGRKLRSEKSINIPDSLIRFEGLTTKDIVDLQVIASQADMVGVSFIRDVRDITVLRHELQKLKAQNLGIVLKIETQSGYDKLPLLLLEAMKSPNPMGVMIARGDLAVECGWENVADIQEEILSTCNAAHIPVIWATQVLESLVKSGTPTRAEITDVAAGKRASCIMLNKGKNIRKAVSTLDAILQNSSWKVKAEHTHPLLFQASL